MMVEDSSLTRALKIIAFPLIRYSLNQAYIDRHESRVMQIYLFGGPPPSSITPFGLSAKIGRKLMGNSSSKSSAWLRAVSYL